MGLTVACARCHDHKFDPIPTLDYYSLAGIFNNSASVLSPISAQTIVNAFNQAQGEVNRLNNELKKANDDLKKAGDNASAEQKAMTTRNNVMKPKRGPPRFEAHTLRDTGSGNMVAFAVHSKTGSASRRFLRIVEGEQLTLYDIGSGRKQLAIQWPAGTIR